MLQVSHRLNQDYLELILMKSKLLK